MELVVRFLVASVFAGTPLLFGTVGEILHEKAGHLNLGVEGMMAMGAFAGFMAALKSNNIGIAFMAAFAAGLLGALVYAVLTVTFMADQNVTGLTLTIFGVGVSNFFGQYMLKKMHTTSLKLPEGVTSQMGNLHIPGLSNLPVIGPLLFQYNVFVYTGILIAIACWYYLYHTKHGLALRAIGENPGAADAAGISVTKMKYLHILLGGGIAGIGGAYCSMIICGGVWMSNSVNGLGWIAVALVIFAGWNPAKALLGSFLFRAFDILKYYAPKEIITIPNAIYDMLPYIVTALVLIISSIRKSKNSQPASCGRNYFREER